MPLPKRTERRNVHVNYCSNIVFVIVNVMDG